MVCVHTYSESDNALLGYGHLKFSKMAFVFGPRVGFSGTADRTAPFPVGSNSRWLPAAILENFKWQGKNEKADLDK